MKSSIFPLSCFLTLLGVMCSTSTATPASFSASYDDLPGSGAIVGTGLGTYKDIIYDAWFTSSYAASLVGGFAPESPPNTILTNNVAQATNGTPTFTVAPPYTSASFKSFFFACNLSTKESEVDKAVQCTITVAGFQKSSNQETANASFTASPPLNLIGKFAMVQAVLPSTFDNVYKVTVIQDNPTTEGLGIDNLVYTVFK